MNRLLTALAVGVALGLALLGMRLPVAHTSPISTESSTHSVNMAARTTAPWEGIAVIAPSHSDSNTGGDEALPNPNMIQGRPTTVCTTDPTWFRALAPAIRYWNSALSTLTFGDDGSEHPLELYRTAAGHMPTAANGCTDIATGGVDVVAVAGQCRSGGLACYEPRRDPTTRRMEFETPVAAGQAYQSTEHATLIYNTGDPVTFNVAVHELGHVLGLRDYRVDRRPMRPQREGCDDLRRDTVVDPAGRHFSVMRNNQQVDCWSEGVITGRDLRDLYEAYHVGAITRVALQGPVTLQGGALSATLSWGDGINQARHNASHIAILRQAAGSTTWELVESRLIDATVGTMQLTDRRGLAERYKVVGLTRGDIRRQAAVNEIVVIGGRTYAEGDPSIIVGVVPWTDPPDGQRPGYFSVSVSPEYCYAQDTVRVTRRWIGTPAPTVVGLGGRVQGQPAVTVSCGRVPGVHDITTSSRTRPAGNAPPGTATVPRTISLPVNVHARPTGAALRTVSVSQSNGFSVSNASGNRTDQVVVDCSQGDTSQVRWMVEHGVPPVGVWVTPVNIWMPENDWVAGFGASPVTIRCPSSDATDQMLGVIALGADGGGEEAMSGSIARPLAQPAAVTLSSTQPTTATLTWSAPGAGGAGGAGGGAAGAAGAAGASDLRYGVWRSRGTVDETTATTYEFENLTPYQTYGLVVWAENQAGDRSPAVRVRVTLPGRANELRTRAPSTVTVRRVTTNSATLVWSGVSGATGYIVWRSHGREVNLPAAARSHTFRGLTRGRDYSLLVRATGPAGVSPWARKAINTSRFRPSAPTGLRATRTPTSARLYWNAVPGAVGYELWRSKGEREWTRAANHPFDDLMPYETYNLYVRTRNASGDVSRWAILGVTLPGRPGVARTGPPTGLTTSGLTSTSVTLNWNAGTAVSEYGVWRSNGSTVQLDSGARRHTFENLMPGTRYALMVWAEGHGGVSIWKRRYITTPARVTTPVRPDPPSNLRATATTTSLRLTWNAAPGATSYEVKLGSSGTVRTVSSGRRYYRFPGLRANVPYTLYVRTVKGASKSLWSPPHSARTNEIPRPVVLPPKATHNSLKLIWRSVGEATSYDVKLGAGGTIRNTTRTDYTFPRLPSNWSRTLFVRARNAGGVSRWNSRTGTTTPPAPTGLHADATTTTLTLTWTADRLASRYDVGIDEPVVIADTGKTKYEFPDLSPNTQYTLYVRAKTGAGPSPWEEYPAKTAPVAPSGLSVAPEKTSLTLSWGAVTGATGYAVRKNSGSAVQVSGTSYEFSGLTVDTAYKLEVQAKGGNGASRWVPTTTRTAAFEGRIRARLRSNGKVEFCFQLRSQISSGGCIKPTDRFVTPSTMTAGHTRRSSSISATINGVNRTIGQISATRPSSRATYLKVCFTPHGGSEVCPTKHKFYWAQHTVNSWARTSITAYQLPPAASGAAGAAGSDDYTMEAASPSEPDVPGSDGGLMGSDP